MYLPLSPILIHRFFLPPVLSFFIIIISSNRPTFVLRCIIVSLLEPSSLLVIVAAGLRSFPSERLNFSPSSIWNVVTRHLWRNLTVWCQYGGVPAIVDTVSLTFLNSVLYSGHFEINVNCHLKMAFKKIKMKSILYGIFKYPYIGWSSLLIWMWNLVLDVSGHIFIGSQWVITSEIIV